MTRPRQLSETEKRAYRRLKKAFRWAAIGVMKRKGSTQEMVEATRDVMSHAIRIGWIAPPSNPAAVNGGVTK